MATIKTMHINCEVSADDVKEIFETAQGLDFDFCSEPVEVYVGTADNTGRNATAQMHLDVLVENEIGHFGFSI